MPIPLKCGCGKQLNVRDEMAGKAVKCPGCAKAIRVPAAGGGAPAAAAPRPAAKGPAAPRPAAAPAPAQKTAMDDLFTEEGLDRQIASICPACSAEMKADAVLCTKCGFNKQTGERLDAHQVAGVDVSMGEVALQQAAKHLEKDAAEQQKMLGSAGMPPWLLGLILFILGSATAIAVVAVNASRREETIAFNPLQAFCNMGGSAFLMVAIGAVFTLIVQAFRSSRNEGLFSLSILYLFYFAFKKGKVAIMPLLVAIVCGACAGGFFAAASLM